MPFWRTGLLARLARPLRRLGLGRDEGGQAPPAPTAAESHGGALVDDEFRLSIDTLHQDVEGRFQTKLQIISLVEFREAVGERWAKVADKVMLIAEGVIKVYIGQGNLFVRQGQDFFVLLFRSCPQPEGRRRAVMIAQDLGVRLLGDQFQGLDRPLALAAELSLDEALLEDGSFNMAAIHSAVGEVRAAATAPPRPGDTPLRRSLMPGGPAPAAAEANGRPPIAVTDDGAPAGPGPDPEWRPIAVNRRRRSAGDLPPPLPEPAKPAAKPAAPAAPRLAAAGHAAPALPADTRLSVAWRPTWMAAAEAVAVYKAEIRRQDGDDAPILAGGRAYPAGGGGADVLDRAVIAAAARELAVAGRSVLLVPVHWASATSGRRMSLTQPLAEVPRVQRIVMELFGLPPDVAPRQLEDPVRALRPLGREVLLRLPVASAAWVGIAADCGCAAVGVDLADLPADEGRDERAVLDGLAVLKDAAGKAGLGCYVWGARHRRVVTTAISGGFAMVNGPALMAEVERPGAVIPAPRSRFSA